jgi:hypothetical protein
MGGGLAIDLGEWFSENRVTVRKNLDRYFSGRVRDQFTGRWFESFAAMGDPNRFQPSDLLAVEALSVVVPPESAAKLLITDAYRFNGLLERIPLDKDIWLVDKSEIGPGSAAHELHGALDDLKKVGWVTAGKLLAAKRPRLIPILDKEVKRVLKPPTGRFWLTMHEQLADRVRRNEILEACANAPDEVSLLRRIDVALWMYATHL